MFKTSRNNQVSSKFGHVMQYVTCNTNSKFFVKLWLRLRLPVEIRRLKGTPTFPCTPMVGLCYFTYSRPISLPLTHKKCRKYAKLLHILRLLFQEIFFSRKKLTEIRKNNSHNILNANQNHIKIHVPSNRET